MSSCYRAGEDAREEEDKKLSARQKETDTEGEKEREVRK
jgi:hypothetical protein